MDDVSYVGKWTAFGRAVFVEAGNLSHPLIVGERDSACGLRWRDDDTEIEIARALLLHATGEEELAGRLGAGFAEAVLASLPPAGFRLSRERVLGWVNRRLTGQSGAPSSAAARPREPAPRPRVRLINGGGSDPDRPSPTRPLGPNRRRSAVGPLRRAA